MCAATAWGWASSGGVYPVEGELSEDQVARYEDLAELAEAEVLDEAGQAELATLQGILEGDYTQDQKAPCRCLCLCEQPGSA